MEPTELKATKTRVCSKRHRDRDVLDRRPASSSDNHACTQIYNLVNLSLLYILIFLENCKMLREVGQSEITGKKTG